MQKYVLQRRSASRKCLRSDVLRAAILAAPSVTACLASGALGGEPLPDALDLMIRASTAISSIEARFERIQDRHSFLIVVDHHGRFLYEDRRPVSGELSRDGALAQALASDEERFWEYIPELGGYNERPRRPGPLPSWQWTLTPWPVLARVADLVGSDASATADRSADGALSVRSPAHGLALRFDPRGYLTELRLTPGVEAPNRAPVHEIRFEQYASDEDRGPPLPLVVSERIELPSRPDVVATYRALRWTTNLGAEELSQRVRFDPALYGRPGLLPDDAVQVAPTPQGRVPEQPAASARADTHRKPWFWLAACLGLAGAWGALRWWRR